jgi:rhombotail lipoprotein
MKSILVSMIALLVLAVAGCASWYPQAGVKHAGSMVDYLYPDAKEPPQMKPSLTTLRPPVRVGIAFVPGDGLGASLPEAERTRLLDRVKAAFAKYDYIGNIEVIPTQYLRAKGGFDNLDQVSRMFNVEVVALVSYDQVQFNDANALSVLYWTIIGAYIIHGDQYDIQTMVDAAVFDVSSRKLLFRAPGTSQTKGSASMVGFSEHARAARLSGYNNAVDDLIPRLQGELQGFKERIKNDVNFKVENKPGYTGGGDMGWLGILLALALGGAAFRVRSKA